jgi:hypothetical protein
MGESAFDGDSAARQTWNDSIAAQNAAAAAAAQAAQAAAVKKAAADQAEAARKASQALTAAGAAKLRTHFQVPTVQLGGIDVPNTERAIKAGALYLANNLALKLQNKEISQDQFDRSMELLTQPYTEDQALSAPAPIIANQHVMGPAVAFDAPAPAPAPALPTHVIPALFTAQADVPPADRNDHGK